jgi:quercetin dioxygenase-like cupin family protein
MNSKLENMHKGWFIGNFQPTIFPTNDFEVAVKEYKTGDYEEKHFHKLATEITVIVTGKVRMNEIEYIKGDIVVIHPLISTDFLVLEDSITTVVKFPSVKNDKYLGDPN